MDIFLSTLFIIICVLLIAVVLLQKGRGGGLAGAFGGAGGHTAFGSRTGDMFTWVTVVLVALFLGMAVVMNLAFRPPQAPAQPPPAATQPAAPEQPATTPPAGEQPATQPAGQ